MKNIQLTLTFFILVMFSLTFSSCMHAVMMGGHDNHEGMESVSVTKEVSSGDYILAVTIPPMETSKDAIIAITLKSKNGIPDNSTIHYMITKSAMDGASSGHDHGKNDATEDFKPIHDTVSIINGTASITYKPVDAGRFTFSIETTVGYTALSAEVHFMVHEKKGQGMMGMMGMGTNWDYPIIGVLAMGAMMITMWAIRGGF